MTVTEAFTLLHSHGLKLRVAADGAAEIGPKSKLSLNDLALFRAHAARLVALLKPPPEPSHGAPVTPDTLGAALTTVATAAEIVLDVETNGLEPFLAGHRLIGVAIEADGVPFYFPFRHRAGTETNLPESVLARVLEAALQPGR